MAGPPDPRRSTGFLSEAPASTDFDELRGCDAALICVPTLLGQHREPDLSYVLGSTTAVAERLHPGQLVVLESTTYPGTTDEECLPVLEATGLTTPGDFLLAFSLEREDPGNPDFHTRTIPKVVGGVNPESTEAAAALYAAAIDTVVPVSSSRIAGSSKLLENIFRSVNIALVNELKVTFDRIGIDIWEVIEAAKTEPFGFKPFYAGSGFGGQCIPLVRDHRVAAGGRRRGGLLRPYFPKARRGRKHKLEMSWVGCDGQTFGRYDAVVLSTGHRQFKAPDLYAQTSLVVDSRNAVRLRSGSEATVVKA